MGRSYELEVLRSALEEARVGFPRLVWIEGPAGVGKTALVQHFLDSIDVAAALWAGADKAETVQAWETLDRLLASAPTWMQNSVSRVRAAIIASAEVTDVARVLAELMGATARAHQAMLLVVDDAQWADRASVTALRAAFRRLSRGSVLIVATARTEECFMGREDWGRFAMSSDRSQCLALPGLRADDVVHLAAQHGKAISLAGARRLVAHTGGSPLRTSALIKELDQCVLAHGWGPLPAPRDFAALVVSQVGSLSVSTQALMRAVAVLGSPAGLDTAATLAGLTDPLVPLEEAVAASLLSEVVGVMRPEVSFTDPLAEAAVYYAMGPETRRRLHTRAVELSYGQDRLRHQVAAVVGHQSECEVLGLQLERMARDELSQDVLEVAASHLDQAAELAYDEKDRQRRLRSAAAAYLSAGDAAGAQARLSEAKDLTESSTDVIFGQLSMLSGRASAAQHCLEAVWTHADRAEDVQLAARTAGHLATLALHRVDPAEAMRWAGLAGSRLCETGSEASFAAALGFAMAGRTVEALDALNARTALVQSDPGLLLARGTLQLWSDDVAGSLVDFGAVLTATQHRGEHLQLRTHALALLGMGEYCAGSWDDAIAHAELSASLSATAGRPWHAALAHAIVVLPLIGMGEWARAWSHVQAGADLAEPGPVEFVVACVARARAGLAAGLGHYEDALSALVVAERVCDPAEPAFFCDADAKVLTLLAMGRLEEAEEALCIFEAKAIVPARRSALAKVSRMRACLARRRGDLSGALDQFRGGLIHIDNLAMPFEEARLRLDYGQTMAEAGFPAEGREQVEDARSIVCRLRAKPLMEACDALLSTMPSTTSLGPMNCLTASELQVTRLVVAGLRNRDVAERMCISIKTVEAHLTHAYAKLGISQRWELAARIDPD